jgi:hypothetical protein
MPVAMKERTIAYYEIVEVRDGEHFRTGQRDWQVALSGLDSAPIADRSWDFDRTYVGTASVVESDHHLLLHRVRDVNEWLSVIDFRTGKVEELESAASQGYLDTSAVTFLPYGNVVSIMRGSTSAPTHKSLEGWLNHLQFFSGPPLAIRPLMGSAEVERLKTAQGASRIEIRIGAHKAAALDGREGRLAGFLHRAYQDFGDLRITLTISVPAGKARDQDRADLLEELRMLSDIMPGAAEVAKATLTFADGDAPASARITELVEHEITLKRRVPATDESGNSIRIRAAFQVMIGAAAEVEDVLRDASAADLL